MKMKINRSPIIFLLAVAFCIPGRILAQQPDWSKPVLLAVTKAPDMPTSVRQHLRDGAFMIRVKINDIGLVESSEIVKSDSPQTVHAYLQKWISSWRFTPTLQGVKTVNSFTMITIRTETDRCSFKTPPPIDSITQLPDPIVEALLKQDSAAIPNHPSTAQDKADIYQQVSENLKELK